MNKKFKDLTYAELVKLFSSSEDCYSHLLRLQQSLLGGKCTDPSCRMDEKTHGDLKLRVYGGRKVLYCPVCKKYYPSAKLAFSMKEFDFKRVPLDHPTPSGQKYKLERVEITVNPFSVNEPRLPKIFTLCWGLVSGNISKLWLMSNGRDRIAPLQQLMSQYKLDKGAGSMNLNDVTKYGRQIISIIKARTNDFMGIVSSAEEIIDPISDYVPDVQNVNISYPLSDEDKISKPYAKIISEQLNKLAQQNANPYIKLNGLLLNAAARYRSGDTQSYTRLAHELPGFDPSRAESLWEEFTNSKGDAAEFIEQKSKFSSESGKGVGVVFVDISKLKEVYTDSPSNYGIDEINWSLSDFQKVIKDKYNIDLTREEVKFLIRNHF